MPQPVDSSSNPSRRAFLAFVAASPLLAAVGVDRASLTRLLGGSRRDQSAALALIDQSTGQAAGQTAQTAALITSPSEALNVFDFEAVAKQKIPVAHWGYLMTGTDDDATIRANRDGFNRFALRMRRLVDVSRVDTSIDMLGVHWATPIVICPVGSQKAFHAEGEIAVARAARARGHLQVLSTVTTSSVEDVNAARGEPVWYQLYHQADWNQTRQLIKRAEKAGCPAIVFTVDLLGGSNRETMLRAQQVDTRDCSACHKGGKPAPGLSGLVSTGDNRRKPMVAAFEPGTPIPEVGTPTWEFVKRLKDATTMKVLVKGIVTREDAELAIEHGVNGLFVSNHGGRAENSQRATIECLPEVVAGVQGRVPVLIDGGIRRGTDIFKALALGATAVGVGRPYIWGLGAFGQEGVETVLTLLRRELELVMRQAGTTTVKAVTGAYVVARPGG